LYQKTEGLQLPTRIGKYRLLTSPGIHHSESPVRRGDLDAEDYNEQISVLTEGRAPYSKHLVRYWITGSLSKDNKLYGLEIKDNPISILSTESQNGQFEIAAKDSEGETLQHFRFDLQQIVYLNVPSSAGDNQRLAKVELQECADRQLFITRVGNDTYRFEKNEIPFRFTLDIDIRVSYIELSYAQRIVRRHWLAEKR